MIRFSLHRWGLSNLKTKQNKKNTNIIVIFN